MKSLVIGASGQVGSLLYKTLVNKYPTSGTYNSVRTNPDYFKLNISNELEVKDYFKNNQYDTVFIPAAITHVDMCETSPDETYLINFVGIKNVVDHCSKSLIIFYSTDYVFDGEAGPYKEEDFPNPICTYGIQKLMAENYVKEFAERYRIIRTNGVFGPEPQGKNFVLRLVQNLKLGNEAKIPVDEFGTPTFAPDLVNHSIELATNCEKGNGIYHIAGPKWMNRWDFSLDIARTYGYPEDLIKPVFSSTLNRPALRPKKAGLINSDIKPQLQCISHLEALSLMKND